MSDHRTDNRRGIARLTDAAWAAGAHGLSDVEPQWLAPEPLSDWKRHDHKITHF